MTIYGAQSPDTPLFDEEARSYDAVLVMSFGGPEGNDDVIPFLEKVAGGRGIPRARLEEVAHHYYDFGGVSPINAQNRALIAALETELQAHNLNLPVYFGNRNWHPFIEDTVKQMRDDGVKRAIVFFTSAFSSYSSCRQYREDIIRAREAVHAGADSHVPEFDKIRLYYNHPGFIGPMIENTCDAIAQFEPENPPHIVFTAHSIPLSMAKHSDYVAQLEEVCRLVAAGANTADYRLVYQSRSGSPHTPWLEPDICDYLTEINELGIKNVVIVPVGFISDHMEVMFDLDTEAAQLASELGMKLVRAHTVGTHPAFVTMIRELIQERMTSNPIRGALGIKGAGHDICPMSCCLKG